MYNYVYIWTITLCRPTFECVKVLSVFSFHVSNIYEKYTLANSQIDITYLKIYVFNIGTNYSRF